MGANQIKIPEGFVLEGDTGASTGHDLPPGFELEDNGLLGGSQAAFRSAPDKNFLQEFAQRMKNVFRKSDAQRQAEAANIYAISKNTGIPMPEVEKNYGKLSRDPKVTGIMPAPTAMQVAGAMSVPVIAGAATAAPVATAVGVGTMAALDHVVDLNKFVPSDANDATKSAVEMIDFIVKGGVAGGVIKAGSKALPGAVEKFFQKKVTELNLPKTFTLTRDQVADIFQTGKLTTVEQRSVFAGLGLTRSELLAAVKQGLNVEIPGAQIVKMVDKPGWAAFKKTLRIPEAAETFPKDPFLQGMVQNRVTSEAITPIKEPKAPAGLLPAEVGALPPGFVLEQPPIDEARIRADVEAAGGKFTKLQSAEESMYGEPAVWYDTPIGSSQSVPLSKFSVETVKQKIDAYETKQKAFLKKRALESAYKKLEVLPTYEALKKNASPEKLKIIEEKMAKAALTPEEEAALIADFRPADSPIPPMAPPPTSLSSETGSALNVLPDLSLAAKAGNLLKYYAGTKEERLQSVLGEEKGRTVFEKIRLFDRAVNLVQAETVKRNKEIFAGLPLRVREHIFDVLKGIKGMDATGQLEFGALQPSGVISAAETMDLGDDRLIGEPVNANETQFQTYRRFNTEKEYNALIEKFPHAKTVIEKYLAAEEDVKRTLLGTEIPAFSRNALKEQFNIVTKQPEDFSYVPSVKKEERILAKLKNIFKSYTAGGRRKKTGELAELGLEEKDLYKAYTQRQTELTYENLYNNTAGDILALVLEPIVNRKLKPGYVQLNINHPRINKITELKKDLFEAHGIRPDEKSLYQYPRVIEDEFKLQKGEKFHTPELQDAYEAAQKMGDLFVGGVTTNYLIKPSTANRNFVSGLVQYNLRTLTHFYEGIFGKASSFGAALNDIKALGQALTPSARKGIPSQVLGDVFQSDIAGPTSVFRPFLAPFRAIEYYFKRASFISDLNTLARERMKKLEAAGKPVPADKRAQYIADFKENFFLDVFQSISDNADSVTFDYWNKPYFLEKLPKALVPFPNYLYHKARMYAEYSPAALIGMDKNNGRTRAAKAMAGLTMAGLAFMVADNAARERSKEKEELAFKKMEWKFDTTGRIKIYADDEVRRWLRVYDWPFLGDILYWREIMDGSADFGDWLKDSLSLGPFFTIPAALLGLKSKYEAQKDTPGLLGTQVAGWIPFGAYLNYARVLADPVKRERFSEDYSAFENFMNPIIDTLPGASKLLDPDVAKIGMEKGQVRQYDIPSETMKMFFLNVKSIDNQEYLRYITDQETSGKQLRRMKRQAREEYEKEQ